MTQPMPEPQDLAAAPSHGKRDTLTPAEHPARARIRLVWGRATMEAEAQITPAGLLAIGGMVGAILLAVAPIVRAAGEARRRS